MSVEARIKNLFFVSSEIAKFKKDKELLRELEKNHQLSVLIYLGMIFFFVMSFILMTLGALIIQDQFPEISWVINYVSALF